MALTLTGAMLREMFPRALDGYVNAIEQGARLLDQFGVNTPLRMSHFLAQGAHETGSVKGPFTITEESGNYSAARLLEVFPHHFTPGQAAAYAHKPQMILSRSYAGRLGNAGELSRDGWRYRGRGMVQLTGRENYARRGTAGLDLVTNPDLAADPAISLKIMLQEWSGLGLNEWADKGAASDVVLACSRGINCGSPTSGIVPNGLAARRERFAEIWAKLGDGSAARVDPAADGILEEGEQGDAVRRVQQALADLGYQIGIVDGIYGERTEAAVVVYQQRGGFAADAPGKWRIGVYDSALAGAQPFDMAARQQITAAGLINGGDPQARQLSLGKRIAGVATAATAVAGTVQQADVSTWTTVLGDARGIAEPIIETVHWAAQSVWIAAGLACAALYVLFHRAQAHHIDAVQQGETTP